ncbi:hypothetical protein Tsubulata_015114 [Turnera subulata]|uniref:Uncharacterized protein n=1 Tax=Turnera subulata TaxID=218843 RepID=A0A9Q0JLP8_9ROSI|nr:hypothetical protein Tsubulata_015114 [Turnera subulata]
MAGLQYYFFPTDFYYPRPLPQQSFNKDDDSTVEGVHQQVQTQKVDIIKADDIDNNHQKANKFPRLVSASTALVPSPCIIKSEKRRRNLNRLDSGN